MSTNDVPGAVPANADTLHVGCWAEHQDGSLIFVYSAEGKRIIFSIFEMKTDPPHDYRTAMDQTAFEKQFSWDSKRPKGDKWTWHDKSPFPWDRVIKDGAKEGVAYPSVEAQLSAAERTVSSLKKHGLDVSGEPVSAKKLAHLRDALRRPSAKAIAEGIRDAINSCDAPRLSKQLEDLAKLEADPSEE